MSESLPYGTSPDVDVSAHTAPLPGWGVGKTPTHHRASERLSGAWAFPKHTDTQQDSKPRDDPFSLHVERVLLFFSNADLTSKFIPPRVPHNFNRERLILSCVWRVSRVGSAACQLTTRPKP